MRRLLVIALVIVGGLRADLAKVKSEPNLEKRSELALDYANAALDDAKKLYPDSPAEFTGRINEVREAVELSYDSLRGTGKAARRSPKYFKRAEMRIRALIRRLDNLEKEISLEDREPVQAAKNRIGEVHDQVLLDIMSKK